MKNLLFLFLFVFITFLSGSCKQGNIDESKIVNTLSINDTVLNDTTKIFPGAFSTAKYLPLLKNKRVALVVNQSSILNGVHLSDTLLDLGVNVVKIFAPEHGFRGKADAGKIIDNTIDSKTGLPIVSLYGKKEKPNKEDLSNIEIVIFDIQDVGVRFYTYISTLTYVMESCGENNIPILVFDRPNPNGHYIDGPILEPKYKSFVGLIPIPIVYGLTMGELAQMINGEGWMSNNVKCNLTVIPCTNYTHQSHYQLPIRPSPNLPDFASVSLYPSLCFFEGTTVSVGRGTNKPFKQIGHPSLASNYKYKFVPLPNEGASNPKLKGESCFGIDLSNVKIKDFRHKGKIELSWLIEFYNNYEDKEKFFLKNNWIDKLAGTDELRKMIIQGKTSEEIKEVWKTDLIKFNSARKKYLLYPDFE